MSETTEHCRHGVANQSGWIGLLCYDPLAESPLEETND